jgi:hypothetical protein
MIEPFPRHRREALQEYQTILAGCNPTADRRPMDQLIAYLADADYRSLLLPVDGHFVSSETPTTFTLANCRLPFPRMVLEYSTATAGPRPAYQKNFNAHLVVVDWQESSDELKVWYLTRGLRDQGCAWSFAPIGIRLNKGSHVSIAETGHVISFGTHVYEIPPIRCDQLHLNSFISYYNRHLGILAHLSMLMSTANISVQKLSVPAAAPVPDECYRLKCTGPTHFQWLPASGMSNAAAS